MTKESSQAVRERPILFSASMVNAILAGRKTVTRRVMKPAPIHRKNWSRPGVDGWEFALRSGGASTIADDATSLAVYLPRDVVPTCPYGQPGDRLWVKETIRRDPLGETSHYAADGAPTVADAWPWKRPVLPAIHCPRGLRRIKLEVVSVRVERLHDITDGDAMAEGARHFHELPSIHPYGQDPRWSCGTPTSTAECLGSARHAFGNLWEQINGRGSWEANPWVWRVEFRRMS